MAEAHTNRLAREKSPYLLQHAHNPVDWFAWGEEAFARARAENKPIFLSIGYSTCHWCHVMERESFENEKVGAFLNEHFVSIKVDREERPDVDKIYMTFVQATTGGGGWPMNVFLTPGLKPFFGGTYFSPDNRQGRPGFLQVLRQIVTLWRERHGELAASADEIHARLEAATAHTATGNLILTAEALRDAAARVKSSYDPRHGGFGGAPKFPQPSLLMVLLRCARRFHDDEAAHMVLHTGERMAAGGIHDQLGGGFARYAVDAGWLVPHFEKMLYDNAQLAQFYLDAHLISGGQVARAPESSAKKNSGLAGLAFPINSNFASVAGGILNYVLRDLTHPGGGFYSAEDADSEGHEGKFYCWTRDELSKLLTVEEFNVVVRYFGITERGNFIDHSHPHPLPGQNVLSRVGPDLGADDLPLLKSAKKKMLNARSRRVRPHLDDKILVSWNGLMLGALARAWVVLGDEKYRAAAERNLQFIQAHLWQAPPSRAGSSQSADGSQGNAGAHGLTRAVGALFHRWRDGERDDVQLLAGYAFLLDGVIQLYEATLEPKHLDFAIRLAETMMAKFCDVENGGFWQNTADAKDLILRVKDDYDGAEPSGNSVATLTLLKLSAITGREDFKRPAEATLRLFAHRLQNFPQAMPFMLHALDFWLDEPCRVVVAGKPDSARARKLLHAVHSVYQPNKIVLGNAGAVEEFALSLPSKNGPVVYLCSGKTCRSPTDNVEEVQALLR